MKTGEGTGSLVRKFPFTVILGPVPLSPGTSPFTFSFMKNHHVLFPVVPLSSLLPEKDLLEKRDKMSIPLTLDLTNSLNRFFSSLGLDL